MARTNKAQPKSEEGVTLSSFFAELAKVQGSQRSLVIVTHGFVELLVNTVIDSNCRHRKKITSNHRDFSHSVKLVLLSELGLLDKQLYQILDWFRKLRNKAAHEVFFKLTPDDVEFANKSMRRFLPGAEVEPIVDDLDRFCKLLIGTIWNRHLDILVPIFESKLRSKEKDEAKGT